jgi:signal transduction histidine kinase
MRLVTRMSATLAVVGLGVFGAYGAWLTARERVDLRAAAERETVFLGTSLRVSIENALRDRQLSDVEEVTLRLEGVDTTLDVFVFDPRGQPVVAPTGRPWAELAALAEQSASLKETRLVYVPAEDPEVLLLATPLLSDDGERQGALGIVRPLDDVNEDLLETQGSIAVTVGAFVLLSALLGLTIGQARLGRPLERLTGAMRAVRQGDVSTPLVEEGDDELMALSAEFNAMLRDLREARAVAEVEADARQKAMRSLQEADRLVTVGQLSAAVAHEIGSPLQVLLGRARALAERPEDAEQTRRVAIILVREAERITRIVLQLLALTRRRPIRREAVDVAEAARTVGSLLELEARRRRVSLALELAAVRPVAADPDQVQQVLLNLLSNALAAARAGGHVIVRVRDGEGVVRISVQDDGVGMDEETQRRAFEPLYTTRSDSGGAGLGLAVVRSIVQEHGGRVDFVSEPGQGTTFVVELPGAPS